MKDCVSFDPDPSPSFYRCSNPDRCFSNVGSGQSRSGSIQNSVQTRGIKIKVYEVYSCVRVVFFLNFIQAKTVGWISVRRPIIK